MLVCKLPYHKLLTAAVITQKTPLVTILPLCKPGIIIIKVRALFKVRDHYVSWGKSHLKHCDRKEDVGEVNKSCKTENKLSCVYTSTVKPWLSNDSSWTNRSLNIFSRQTTHRFPNKILVPKQASGQPHALWAKISEMYDWRQSVMLQSLLNADSLFNWPYWPQTRAPGELSTMRYFPWLD